MPKISILIPVYNVEKYLRECLDSVLKQTLEDIEIICIDDGSRDSSGAVLDEYAKKDSRVRVLHNEYRLRAFHELWAAACHRRVYRNSRAG